MSSPSFTWNPMAVFALAQQTPLSAYGSPALAAADRLLMAYMEGNAGATTNKIQFTQSNAFPLVWDPPSYAQDAAGNAFLTVAAPSLAVTGSGIFMAWAQKDNSFASSVFDPVAGTWSPQVSMQSGGEAFVTSASRPAAPALTSYEGDLHAVWSTGAQFLHSCLAAGSNTWTSPTTVGNNAPGPVGPSNWSSPFPPALCTVGDQLLLVWVSGTGGFMQSAYYAPDTGVWLGPVSVPAESCSTAPSLTAIGDGQALLAYGVGEAPPYRFAWATCSSPGPTWTQQQFINGIGYSSMGAQTLAYTGANAIMAFPSGNQLGGSAWGVLAFGMGSTVPSADWMAYACEQNLGGDFSQRTLSQIVMPGAHDAGMYTGGFGGRTQDQDFCGQMSGGVRYFDCRVGVNTFQTQFYHGSAGAVTLTWGALLADALASMKTYLQVANRREVIVLKFIPDFSSEQDYNDKLIGPLTAALGSWIYQNSTGKRLADIPVSEFMKTGKSTVIVVVDTTYTTTAKGIYKFADAATACPQGGHGDPTAGDLRVYDCYSNTTDVPTMTAGQLRTFNQYTGYCDSPYSGVASDLYLISWTVTPVTAVRYYADDANLALLPQLSGLQRNSQGQMPNIIYLDYYETAGVMDLCWTLNARFTISQSAAAAV